MLTWPSALDMESIDIAMVTAAMFCWRNPKCFNSLIANLLVRPSRLREIKELTWGHPGKNWLCLHLNPGLPDLKAHATHCVPTTAPEGYADSASYHVTSHQLPQYRTGFQKTLVLSFFPFCPTNSIWNEKPNHSPPVALQDCSN